MNKTEIRKMIGKSISHIQWMWEERNCSDHRSVIRGHMKMHLRNLRNYKRELYNA